MPIRRFQRGDSRPPGSGRVIGQPNKTTQLLKDAILMAAEMVGEVEEIVLEGSGEDDERPRIKLKYSGKDGLTGYLRWLATKHPASFTTLLAKVLPLQVRVDGSVKRTYRNVEEIRAELTRRGVRLDRLLRPPLALPPPAPTADDVYRQPDDGDADAPEDNGTSRRRRH